MQASTSSSVAMVAAGSARKNSRMLSRLRRFPPASSPTTCEWEAGAERGGEGEKDRSHARRRLPRLGGGLVTPEPLISLGSGFSGRPGVSAMARVASFAAPRESARYVREPFPVKPCYVRFHSNPQQISSQQRVDPRRVDPRDDHHYRSHAPKCSKCGRRVLPPCRVVRHDRDAHRGLLCGPGPAVVLASWSVADAPPDVLGGARRSAAPASLSAGGANNRSTLRRALRPKRLLGRDLGYGGRHAQLAVDWRVVRRCGALHTAHDRRQLLGAGFVCRVGQRQRAADQHPSARQTWDRLPVRFRGRQVHDRGARPQ